MKRRLTTIVAALVLAGIGTLAVFLYVQGADNRAVAGKRAVDVLVASRAIPAGTAASRLKSEGFVRTERMPAESISSDVLQTIDSSINDLVVGSNIKDGELIRRPLLVAKGDAQAFTIPDKKIAVTVSLTNPQQVAGYVGVGSKVAVFLTYRTNANDKTKSDTTATRLLMSDIEVLSIGPAKDSGGSGSSSDSKTLVTMAVDQHQAELLIWGGSGAQGGGQESGLYLGLQNGSSDLSDKSPGVSSFKLFQ
jgi:pilus assembly protein CpaB